MTTAELRPQVAPVAPESVWRRLVEFACLAPSVHNTQPWIWEIGDGQANLYVDRSRMLPIEDRYGRNVIISCGAALHHLHVAAHALGWDTSADLLPDLGNADLLAAVRLVRGRPSATPEEDLATLRTRCTDRRRFTTWPVPEEVLDRLAAEAQEWHTVAQSITDPAYRFRLETLAGQARAIHEADSRALREQGRWTGRTSTDGIPDEVLPAEETDHAQRSRFGPGLMHETRAIVEAGDGVIALGGRGDDRAAWLRTGQGLSALWLRATRDGLSVVPLSLPVEIESVREQLRDRVLNGSFTPHLLVRIGWQAIGRTELPRTPRRPVADVLRSQRRSRH